MFKGNEILGKEKNFKYGFSYASNIKTAIGLEKQGFVKISEYDSRTLQYRGAKPFALIH